MDPPSLHRLFSACDVNKSGKIEYEDFTFGGDQDGYIDYSMFSSRFQRFLRLWIWRYGAGSFKNQACPREEFVGRSQEQLADLYQTIHSSANKTLLQQYEEVIQSLISLNLENRLECEQLDQTEEMNNSQLTELEEDIQQQLARTEQRVRDNECKKMEEVMANLQRKHKNEVTDLHATVDRLLKSLEDSDSNDSKEEVVRLNRQITHLSQENEDLRASLLQAQTNIAVLHSEMDKLKNMYADQKAQHGRETDELKRMVIEYQSYANQIQILQATNKKLYDSNDGLRSALASEAVASKRRLSPQNEIPARRMKPLRQSTLNHSSSEPDPSKTTFSHVSTWADKYLDSGVSLPMDTAEGSGSDYESDDSRVSVETVHHSYSYVPSDMEISEMQSEATVSVAPSKANSITSSLRRRLSAFSTKHLGADIEEGVGPAPMYRLVLAGDAGAGKSSFLLRLTLNEFRGDMQTTLGKSHRNDITCNPTLILDFTCVKLLFWFSGVDFQIKRMLVDGERTSLQIWDTAGQERFRSIARSYFRKAHGVLLLYDVTSESSFLNVREWVDQIQDSTEEKIPMCVIGNKVDLREQLPEGSCVSSIHGEKLAKVCSCSFHLIKPCLYRHPASRAYGALFCETKVKKNVTLRRQSDSQVRLSPSGQKKSLNACCGL
ncbi:hypothetical protein F7725_022848 [Dissostichus mawsoni]|uniref:Ras and EF-hand domain-containing protein n=1 Tax=Dissostichus mawsoni TaxID=36200 RepID=A0A7J5YZZ2_DISMA|nr:hypothetical protein F7725_022848 [Dissostichus mawsoni]